ncbi:MAG: hypothetical protein K9N46_15760 [Candidatus Marinimicrobia bacterium]|nr:hypothetical protein [Candidatus Neomarinimicrobiota bacterium]MCF7830278.1 hypothetical protein [Candidatus Neomarinimicrobiota bacterium]MCF7882187.1 hypothetical protein [Candidatus Neomarinimicrobiota bacterium]
MAENRDAPFRSELRNTASTRAGFVLAVSTAVITLITFAIAVATPPLSGPFCQGNCFDYPYLDILSRFPRDYYWMYPAMLLMLVFVGFVVAIHSSTPVERRFFSLTGVAFAVMASGILFTNYFVQVSVIQPSLLAGETDGIALLTQYNPHGLFIALEEVGYIAMAVALFATAPVFAGNRVANAVRWIFVANFAIVVIAFILISAIHGIHREYIFEVAVISVNFLTLIIGGVLVSRLYKRALTALEQTSPKAGAGVG